jgi:enoyl-CoA hydratase/carnithine racemase
VLTKGLGAGHHRRRLRCLLLRRRPACRHRDVPDRPRRRTAFDPSAGLDNHPIPAEGNIGPTRWTDIHKPIIAAVNGAAYAGGLEWACLANLRIADEHASFGVTCRRWNVGLGDGGTQRLPRLIGLSRAMDLIITGRVIGAREAERFGLVNEVTPAAIA